MKCKDDEIISLMLQPNSSEKGLRAMMDTYQSRLYWHIRRLIVQHDLAQDVLQDTFIKAYNNFSQFKQDSKLYTWLYRIATNEALQQLAKLKIKALPANLPDEIVVDVTPLRIGNKLYVGSIKNEAYTFLHPDNAVVAAVKMSRNAMKNAGAVVEDDDDEEAEGEATSAE